MDLDFDPHRTLLELTDGQLELPDADRHLEAFLSRAASKQARRLSLGELLVLLRHHLALEYVAPLAIDRLEPEPWLQVERNPGDLLIALLESDSRMWRERQDLWLAVIPVLEKALEEVAGSAAPPNEDNQETPATPPPVGDDFMAALLHFRGLHDA